MIKINGKYNNDIDNINLAEYLLSCGYNTAFLAVELNGVIVKKSEYEHVVLRDGDSVEIVCFVGGG